MNSGDRRKNALPKWSVLLVLFTLAAFASAQKKENAPAPHASAPSKPAPSAPHAAPAQRPGGSPSSAQRPGMPSGAPNRGPSGQASRPGAPSPSRGPSGGNANKGAMGGGNRPGQTGGNRPGQTGGNRPGQTAGSRPGNAGASIGRHQPAGSKNVALRNGGSATFRSNGQVRTIQARGMTINRGMRGNTRIVSMHNGRTVVSNGRYGGYSQRAYYNRGGRVYVQRTYFVGGHYYAYGYRSYYWGGRPYYGYAPAYYWGPAYYGWVYNPWPAPVYYGWGWGPQPWFGFYGPYFAPYPVYPTAAFWLTDYLIAANLQAAYAAQQEAAAENGEARPLPLTDPSDEMATLFTTDPVIAANLEATYGPFMFGAPAANGGTTQLSPEVKQALADEMKQEIAAEKDAAASGQKDAPSGDQMPAALNPKIRIFVVSSEEDLTTSASVECSLTAGDVISRATDNPDADNMVDAVVKSSKKDECAVGVTVAVAVDDLQEMHNQLRIQMDAGLKELADKQGKNGLPSAPDTKTQAGEVPPPSPDKSVSSDLQQQQKDAAQVEADAKQSQ